MSMDHAFSEDQAVGEAGMLRLLSAHVNKVIDALVTVEVSAQKLLSGHLWSVTDFYTAMISFAGACNGMLYLHVPERLAKTISASMLEAAESEIGHEDISDALGELLSIIGGSLKRDLSPCGHESRLSIPSIVHSKECPISPHRLTGASSLLFAIDDEWLAVSVQLESLAEGV